MAKKRRGGRRQQSSVASRIAPSRGPKVFLAEGSQAEGQLDDAADGSSEERDAPAEVMQSAGCQAKVLDLLSSAQLSATYGKGFELLQRMGFTAGSQGLRADSLAAPLRAHNQGRSRMGVQGEEEGSSPPFVAAPNVAQGASRPMNELLMEVLASMQENGDAEEAEELRGLAACVGLEGSLGSLEAMEPPAKRRRNAASRNKAHFTSSDGDALSAVMHSFRSSQDFPVELAAQSKHLSWKKCWQQELGNYESFIERHDDEFQLIRCPAPHGTLVFPRKFGKGDPWVEDRRYLLWCYDHRLAATGKAKRKWKHVERMVARFLKGQKGSESSDCNDDVAGEVIEEVTLPNLAHSSSAKEVEEVGVDGWNEDTQALEWREDTLAEQC